MKSIQCAVALATITLFLTGCAASPESIAPTYVSGKQYSYLNCGQLADYKRVLASAYYSAADSENSARNIDAATFILVGVPVGSMTHESVPSQIADLKGRIAAVQRLQIQHSCKDWNATAEN